MIIKVSEGDKISISNNKLIILNNIDSEGELLEIEEKRGISLKDIRLIIIENVYSSITIKTLLELSNNKIHTIICNEKYQPQLQVFDLYSNYKVTERIYEQKDWSVERKQSCFQQIIYNKIKNQKELLYFIEEYDGVDYLSEMLEKIEKGSLTTELKSIEGVSARIYFQRVFGEKFRRFNNDVDNAALNYGYTLVRTLVAKILISKGLHPALGIEHKSMFNNFNLADDIIEIFRPIVDYVVWSNLEKYEDLSKEYRNTILKILFQNIKYKDSFNDLDYVIEKFVDNIISYMNEKTEEIEFPQLVIEDYDY
ncbi:MAG: type II CRISPR-associated endonuclease Cas1 [Fusobacteriaceae bacterium]